MHEEQWIVTSIGSNDDDDEDDECCSTRAYAVWSFQFDVITFALVPIRRCYEYHRPTDRLQQTGELEQVTRECGGKDGQATGEVNAIFRHVDNPHVFNYIT